MLANWNIRFVTCRRVPRFSHPFQHSRLQPLHIGGHVLFDQEPLVDATALIHETVVDMCERNAIQSMPHALKDPTLHGTVK